MILIPPILNILIIYLKWGGDNLYYITIYYLLYIKSYIYIYINYYIPLFKI